MGMKKKFDWREFWVFVFFLALIFVVFYNLAELPMF